MARKLREDVEGGVQHVYARGNNRQPVFFDDVDRVLYLATLGRVVVRTGWRCLAYCLMNNHVHLLVETPEPNLGYGMQRLHGDYARSLNERRERCGHVFQGRYGSTRVKDDEQFWTVVRYIARNPTTAGFGPPAAWPWSSHGIVLGADRPEWLDVGRLLSFFAADGGEPLWRYRELIG